MKRKVVIQLESCGSCPHLEFADGGFSSHWMVCTLLSARTIEVYGPKESKVASKEMDVWFKNKCPLEEM